RRADAALCRTGWWERWRQPDPGQGRRHRPCLTRPRARGGGRAGARRLAAQLAGRPMVARGRAPTRSQEVIYLDPDDDLGTIRAKLESSAAEELYLAIPKRAASLRTPLEFRILARIAHELSTDVTIVSADGGRRHLARQEGLRARRGLGGVRHLPQHPRMGP